MRNEHGRFVAGASGNPGGRPLAVRQARDLIEALTPELVMVLAEIAHDRSQPGRTRLAAVTTLLDRRYGRPRREADWSSGLILPLADQEPRGDEPRGDEPREPAAADAPTATPEPGAAPDGGEPAAEPVAAAAAAEPDPAVTTDQAVKPPARPDAATARPSGQPAPSPVSVGGPWRFGMEWPPSAAYPHLRRPGSEAPPPPPDAALVQSCSEVRRSPRTDGPAAATRTRK